jgi:hypothetical protein
MAIQTDETYKGITLTGAYIRALVSIDVAIYKDKEQRDLGNVLGNKKIDLSNDSVAKIYKIIKNEQYPNAVDV